MKRKNRRNVCTGDNINHHAKLKDLLPKYYRTMIKDRTGFTLSLIDKVLRGERKDRHGIITLAYDLAINNIKNKNRTNSDLDLKMKELELIS